MVARIRVCGVLCSVSLGLFGVVATGAELSESAEAIVKQALVAELDGDLAQRSKLLETAIALSPEYAPARWHSGMIRVGDEWLSVEAAEQQSAAQGLVFEYRQLRDRYAGSVSGQQALARWCRKKQLTDLEALHWENVLRAAPEHREARSRLAVREYRGMLLTMQQIEQHKEQQKAYDRVVEHWKPRLASIAKALDSDAAADRERGRAELSAIESPDAIPAIQQELLKADAKWGVELIRAVGNIKGQAAVDTIVYCSVFSPQNEVREAAAEQLKDRSMFSYVPTLLGAMETPIELSYYVKVFAKGFQYGCEIQQERADGNHVQSFGIVSVRRRAEDIAPRYAANAQQFVAEKNQLASSRNSQVSAVLSVTTGQQFGSDPQRWWQWWADYNQLTLSKQTVRDDRVKSMSCFLRGTQVWTDTGAVPIEAVRVGDRVLAQDQDSGELSYKLVVDTTVRPPSPSIRLGVGGEEIVATLGHPMWVAGKGWRMTKELEAGEMLRGVHGSVPIDYIQAGPEAEAYNLVVADFHNYFVGKDRVLVHDNHLRKPTEAILPGYVAVK